jgi:sec-independent protein translocase protein TatA
MGLDSPLHIILLLGIVLLVFGARRLPEVGRSLGAGLRGFKESVTEEPTVAPRSIEPPPATGRPADDVAPHPVATTRD